MSRSTSTMGTRNVPALVEFDKEIQDIVTYVYEFKISSKQTTDCAKTALLDALGCAIETVAKSADCRRLVGPIVPNTEVPYGCRIPGTSHIVDPIKGAFDTATLIRYLDHNDAFAGKDWGHPSGMSTSLTH